MIWFDGGKCRKIGNIKASVRNECNLRDIRVWHEL